MTYPYARMPRRVVARLWAVEIAGSVVVAVVAVLVGRLVD